jgi:lipoic acid synthetase
MTTRVRLYAFPVTPYDSGWRWQQATAAAVREGGEEALALLQHAPVYTFGRRVRTEHLLVPSEVLRARGADLVETNRGGDVTFHGPGQIVGYPILDLRRRSLSPTDYVRKIEETLIRTCDHFGLESRRVAGRPGVWTGSGKIGAVGVRIESGVSLHGFALNVDLDLSWFAAIVPCGLAGVEMTSMQQILGASPCVETVSAVLVREFATVFDIQILEADPVHKVVHAR